VNTGFGGNENSIEVEEIMHVAFLGQAVVRGKRRCMVEQRVHA
jgi:hypothetical protein